MTIEAAPAERADTQTLLASFSPDEAHRLARLQSIWAAERCLVPRDQPCHDHQVCRRLAFVLWLDTTGRLSEDDPHAHSRVGNPSERSLSPCCE